MKPLLCAIGLAALATLAGCGVDGEPEPPRVSGQVTLSNTGSHLGLGLSQGPVTLWLGF